MPAFLHPDNSSKKYREREREQFVCHFLLFLFLLHSSPANGTFSTHRLNNILFCLKSLSGFQLVPQIPCKLILGIIYQIATRLAGRTILQSIGWMINFISVSNSLRMKVPVTGWKQKQNNVVLQILTGVLNRQQASETAGWCAQRR